MQGQNDSALVVISKTIVCILNSITSGLPAALLRGFAGRKKKLNLLHRQV